MAILAHERQGSLPHLRPSVSKILEAILFVIEFAEKIGRPASQFDIAKTIFLADYRHLQIYGRPITFDNFHAMKHGPVPSLTYDMLKPTFDWSRVSLPAAPWSTRAATGMIRHFVQPARSANRRKLSESDTSALEQAFRDVKAMGFGATSDFTHKLPAYVEAWSKRGTSKAKEMDLRTLLPDFDDEMISDLEQASKYQ